MGKFHAINSFLAILILAASAKIAADLISVRLTPGVIKSPVADVPSPNGSANEALTAFSPVLTEGMFGPASRGRLTPIETERVSESSTSQADLLLLGTARGSFRETFALIQRISSHEERVFRLGQRVYDLGELVAVHKESVDISVNGRRVTLLTPTGQESDATAAPRPQTAPLARPTGGSSYVISQRALEGALENLGQAMTDARLLPSVKEGKVEGFRLTEVKPTGIFAMVGLQNGDVLLRINDFSINSPESAIQSLAALRGLSRIKLDLLRDGRPQTMTYEIR
ncbi:MAG TPA: type II secretion system protein N [Geobacterales bacterium]|nr:type II secretion system protein N [Geobacterales bacterium]